jgi:uncharacterized protein YndB with AHSA1/START domain
MIQYSEGSCTAGNPAAIKAFLRRTNILLSVPQALLVAVCLCAAASATAAEPLSTDTISNTPLKETWRLLTTADGYRELGVEATVNLRIGGATRIAVGAGLPQAAEILAYDPEHMLALGHYRASAQSPAETPLWTVIYFTPLGADMTSVRIVRLGLEDGPSSDRLRGALAAADRALLDRLVQLHHPKCARCEAEGQSRE